jgi:hypothetical protein
MFNHDPYCSAYPQFAGQTLDWLPNDTKQLYEIHTRKTSNSHTINKLNRLGFNSQNVKYKFNNFGFRCNEFLEKDNIVFLGCSLTLGIGINLEDTFSQILSSSLSLNNCNLALAGGSNDALFRIAYHWLPQLKPKVVVCYAPIKARSEITIDGRHESLLPALSNSKWYLDYLKEEKNYIFNYHKNRLAIENLCKQINTKLLFLHIEDWEFDYTKDLARDLLHPGVKSHRLIATEMLKLLKDKGVE